MICSYRSPGDGSGTAYQPRDVPRGAEHKDGVVLDPFCEQSIPLPAAREPVAAIGGGALEVPQTVAGELFNLNIS